MHIANILYPALAIELSDSRRAGSSVYICEEKQVTQEGEGGRVDKTKG
jgi:hypothetical protein